MANSSKKGTNDFKRVREQLDLSAYLDSLDRFKLDEEQNTVAEKVYLDQVTKNVVRLDYSNNKWNFEDDKGNKGSSIDFHVRYIQNISKNNVNNKNLSAAVRQLVPFMDKDVNNVVTEDKLKAIINSVGSDVATKSKAERGGVDNPWEKIKQGVNLEEYIQDKLSGRFEFVPNQSSSKYRSYRDTVSGSYVNVNFSKNQGVSMNTWSDNAGVGGMFIDFHMRFEQGFVGSTKGSGNKKEKHIAMLAGLDYLNENPERLERAKKPLRTSIGNGKADVKRYDLPDNKDNSYLKNRGISQETLDLPILKGRYGSTKAKMGNLAEHKNDFVVPLFGTDKDGVPGIIAYERKNYLEPNKLKEVNDQAYKEAKEVNSKVKRKDVELSESWRNFNGGTGKKYAMWASAVVGKVERIMVFEQALDAMSFIEMHKDDKSYIENTLYLASGGTISEEGYEFIDNAIKKHRVEDVQFATDRDFAGRYYFLKSLGSTTLGSDVVKYDVSYGENSRKSEVLDRYFFNVSVLTKDLSATDKVINNFKKELGLDGSVEVELVNIGKVHQYEKDGVGKGDSLLDSPLEVARINVPYRESNFTKLKEYMSKRLINPDYSFRLKPFEGIDFAKQNFTKEKISVESVNNEGEERTFAFINNPSQGHKLPIGGILNNDFVYYGGLIDLSFGEGTKEKILELLPSNVNNFSEIGEDKVSWEEIIVDYMKGGKEYVNMIAQSEYAEASEFYIGKANFDNLSEIAKQPKLSYSDASPKKSTDWNNELNNQIEEPLQNNISYFDRLDQDLNPSENVFKMSRDFSISRVPENDTQGELKYLRHTIGYFNYSDGSVDIKKEYKGFQNIFSEDLKKARLFTRVVPGNKLVEALMTKGIQVEDKLNKDNQFDKVLKYVTRNKVVELGVFDFNTGRIRENAQLFNEFPEGHEVWNAINEAEEKLNEDIKVSPFEFVTKIEPSIIGYKDFEIVNEKVQGTDYNQKGIYFNENNERIRVGTYNLSNNEFSVIDDVLSRFDEDHKIWDGIEEVSDHIKNDTLIAEGEIIESGLQKDKETTVGRTVINYNGIEVGELDTNTLAIKRKEGVISNLNESLKNIFERDLNKLGDYISKHEETRSVLNDSTQRVFRYNSRNVHYGSAIIGKWDKDGGFIRDVETINSLYDHETFELPAFFDNKVAEIERRGKEIYFEDQFRKGFSVSEKDDVYWDNNPEPNAKGRKLVGKYENGIFIPNLEGANIPDLVDRLDKFNIIYDKEKVKELNIVENNYKNEIFDQAPIIQVLSKYDFEEGNYANTVNINLSETPTLDVFKQALKDEFEQLDYKDQSPYRATGEFEIQGVKSTALENYIERVGRENSFEIDDIIHSPEVRYFMQFSNKESIGSDFKFKKKELELSGTEVIYEGERVGYYLENKKEFVDILHKKDSFDRDFLMAGITKELGADRVVNFRPRQGGYYAFDNMKGIKSNQREAVFVRDVIAENSSFIKNREVLIKDKYRNAREGQRVDSNLFFTYYDPSKQINEKAVNSLIDNSSVTSKNGLFEISFKELSNYGYESRVVFDPSESTVVMNGITADKTELLEAVRERIKLIGQQEGLESIQVGDVYNLPEKEFNVVLSDISIYNEAIEKEGLDRFIKIEAKSIVNIDNKVEEKVEVAEEKEEQVSEQEKEVEAEDNLINEEESNIDESALVPEKLSKEDIERNDLISSAKLENGIIGNSSKLNDAVYDASVFGRSKSINSYLITGEPGVGKEAMASVIHSVSPRSEKPFVTVNMATFGDGTLDSELFGHVKGAFTGASSDKKGLFEIANGGTIFLDEIGEIPAKTQEKLLRVLDYGEFTPVGSNETVKVDVQIVSATNVNLNKAIEEGNFRLDLFYRLGEKIDIPSLNQRREDIPLLVNNFNNTLSQKNEREPLVFSNEAEDILSELNYEGNIRQLRNIIQAVEAIELKDRNVTPEVLIKYVEPINYQYFNEDVINKALEGAVISEEAKRNLDAIKDKYGIVGESNALYNTLSQATQAARADMNVYIHGASGTGKENLAKIIHENSSRKKSKLVTYNAGLINDSNSGTTESDLFGHVEGAFTDAIADKEGLFQKANGGTLFLDELGNLPLSAQSKLLRAIEYGEVRPVGSLDVQKVDVRVIAATNEDLYQAVEEGRFRKDLFDRINQMNVNSPALEEREEDKILIFEHYLSKAAENEGKEVAKISAEAREAIMGYNFPGNVRQIRDISNSAALLYSGKDIPLSFVEGKIQGDLSIGNSKTKQEKERDNLRQDNGSIVKEQGTPSVQEETVPTNEVKAEINFVRDFVLSDKLQNNGEENIGTAQYNVIEGQLIDSEKVGSLLIDNQFVERFNIDKDGFIFLGEESYGRINKETSDISLFETRNGESIRNIQTDTFTRILADKTGFDVSFVEDEQELIEKLAQANSTYKDIAKSRLQAIESAIVLENEQEFDAAKYLIVNIEGSRVGVSMENPSFVKKRDVEVGVANALAMNSVDLMAEDFMGVEFNIEEVKGLNRGLKGKSNNALYNFLDRANDKLQPTFDYDIQPIVASAPVVEEVKEKSLEASENISVAQQLILPVGISGSGKSTWIRERNDANTIVVSPDDIRKEITGSTSDQSRNKEVFELAYKRAEEGLQSGKSVIFDATNVSSFLRKQMLDNLKANVEKDFEPVAKVFMVDTATAKERIKKDIDSGVDRANVPDFAVDIQFDTILKDLSYLESEGFKVIDSIDKQEIKDKIAENLYVSDKDYFEDSRAFYYKPAGEDIEEGYDEDGYDKTIQDHRVIELGSYSEEHNSFLFNFSDKDHKHIQEGLLDYAERNGFVVDYTSNKEKGSVENKALTAYFAGNNFVNYLPQIKAREDFLREEAYKTIDITLGFDPSSIRIQQRDGQSFVMINNARKQGHNLPIGLLVGDELVSYGNNDAEALKEAVNKSIEITNDKVKDSDIKPVKSVSFSEEGEAYQVAIKDYALGGQAYIPILKNLDTLDVDEPFFLGENATEKQEQEKSLENENELKASGGKEAEKESERKEQLSDIDKDAKIQTGTIEIPKFKELDSAGYAQKSQFISIDKNQAGEINVFIKEGEEQRQIGAFYRDKLILLTDNKEEQFLTKERVQLAGGEINSYERMLSENEVDFNDLPDWQKNQSIASDTISKDSLVQGGMEPIGVNENGDSVYLNDLSEEEQESYLANAEKAEELANKIGDQIENEGSKEKSEELSPEEQEVKAFESKVSRLNELVKVNSFIREGDNSRRGGEGYAEIIMELKEDGPEVTLASYDFQEGYIKDFTEGLLDMGYVFEQFEDAYPEHAEFMSKSQYIGYQNGSGVQFPIDEFLEAYDNRAASNEVFDESWDKFSEECSNEQIEYDNEGVSYHEDSVQMQIEYETVEGALFIEDNDGIKDIYFKNPKMDIEEAKKEKGVIQVASFDESTSTLKESPSSKYYLVTATKAWLRNQGFSVENVEEKTTVGREFGIKEKAFEIYFDDNNYVNIEDKLKAREEYFNGLNNEKEVSIETTIEEEQEQKADNKVDVERPQSIDLDTLIPLEEKDIDIEAFENSMKGFELVGGDKGDFVISDPLDDMDSKVIATIDENGVLNISTDNKEELFIIKDQIDVHGIEVKELTFEEGLDLEGIEGLKEYNQLKSEYDKEREKLSAVIEEQTKDDVVERDPVVLETTNDAQSIEAEDNSIPSNEKENEEEESKELDYLAQVQADMIKESKEENQEEGVVLSEGMSYFDYVEAFEKKYKLDSADSPQLFIDPVENENGYVFFIGEKHDEIAAAYDSENSVLLFNQDFEHVNFIKYTLLDAIDNGMINISPDEVIEYDLESKEEVLLGLSIGNDVLNNDIKDKKNAQFEYSESSEIESSLKEVNNDVKIDQKYIYDNGFISNTLIKKNDIFFDSKSNSSVILEEGRNDNDFDILYTDGSKQSFQSIVAYENGTGKEELAKDKMFLFSEKEQTINEVYVVKSPKAALELYEMKKNDWHFRGDIAIVSFNSMEGMTENQEKEFKKFLSNDVSNKADIVLNQPSKELNNKISYIVEDSGLKPENIKLYKGNIEKMLQLKNVDLAKKAIANNQRMFVEGTTIDKKALLYSQFKNVLYDAYSDKLRFGVANEEGGIGSYSVGKVNSKGLPNTDIQSESDATRGIYISNNPSTYDKETGKGINKVVITDSPEEAMSFHMIDPDNNKSTLYVSTIKSSIKEAPVKQKELMNILGGNYKNAEIVFATNGNKKDYEKEYAFKFRVENPTRSSFYADHDYRVERAKSDLDDLQNKFSKKGLAHLKEEQYAKDRNKNMSKSYDNQLTLKESKDSKLKISK